MSVTTSHQSSRAHATMHSAKMKVKLKARREPSHDVSRFDKEDTEEHTQ